MAEDAPGDEHADGYTGPATLTVAGRALAVEALLDARHEPHDGRMHWFGRVRLSPADAAETELVAAITAGTGPVELSTPGGRAAAKVGDVDPWGRYRVTGVGTPPFALDDPLLDED
ncbi:DUF4873 domain-containing protein [Pseudonocardia sp. GCM10023141]|uniref:DUF4873 domain-containing protein n=1 Tax=Pseudonocardia sp. GCM10023141 TaxID=3252653 RepID=UPI003611272A